MSDWGAALDELGRTLQRQREALSLGEHDAVQAFVPPPGLGRLPATLEPRAAALLAEAQALTDQLGNALGATQRELALLHRMKPEAERASYVDRPL